MATLTTQVIGQAGTAITFANANAGGDQCATGSDVKLLVTNGGASSITVTLPVPGKVDGDLTVNSRTVTVAASTTESIPVTDRYRDPVSGLASITYSAVTSVTVAVIR